MANHSFCPTEIIFASTTECNLHCPHCFVTRNKQQLSIDDAINFLKTAVNESNGLLERIGFSGGEPFLYLDFITAISQVVIDNNLLFDRLMTNGDFWRDESDLRQKLTTVYNAGFDGKIGLSFDNFHNQTPERISSFISTVFDIWLDGSIIEIQSVVDNSSDARDSTFINKLTTVATILGAKISSTLDPSTGCGIITLENDEFFIPVQRTPRTLLSDNKDAWTAKNWFTDDWCEGPGQILYVHSDGRIAPCCGFANEEQALIIGKITDSWNSVLERAASNKVVQDCYTTGLATVRKQLEKKGTKFPGCTSDMCTFCTYLCRSLNS